MSQTTRRRLTLALALTPGIGGKTLTRVLTRNDLLGRTPEDFLRLGPEALREEYKLKPKVAETWTSNQSEWLSEADRLAAVLEPHRVHLVTAADAHYPRRIETMDSDPPGLLYLYGNHRLIDKFTFAVLSSRGTTTDQLAWMEKLAESHILDGRTLVSGHDTPEYQRSAVTSLRWGAPRILVLDTGLFTALGQDLKEEPFAAARLWRFQFDPQTDLALTWINPLRTYHRNSNRLRDRLVASLALSLDFVNLRPGGNMHRLALAALAAGRQVRINEDLPFFPELHQHGAQPISPE